MSENHIKLKSSSIEHIDYHVANDTLEIKFTSGATYHYPNCPVMHHEGLRNADSAGAYFQKNIRTRFKGVKV